MDLSIVNIIGWIYIIFTIYRLMLTVYNLVYPFFLAEPCDLHKIAGAKWAGDFLKNHNLQILPSILIY